MREGKYTKHARSQPQSKKKQAAAAATTTTTTERAVRAGLQEGREVYQSLRLDCLGVTKNQGTDRQLRLRSIEHGKRNATVPKHTPGRRVAGQRLPHYTPTRCRALFPALLPCLLLFLGAAVLYVSDCCGCCVCDGHRQARPPIANSTGQGESRNQLGPWRLFQLAARAGSAGEACLCPGAITSLA